MNDKMKLTYRLLIILTMFSLFSRCKKSDETLPDCNDLYVKYVHKWDDNPEHKILIVKPDMVRSFNPDTDFSSLVVSTDEGYLHIKQQVETMISASRQDLQEIVKFNEFNLETIDKLDKAIDRQ